MLALGEAISVLANNGLDASRVKIGGLSNVLILGVDECLSGESKVALMVGVRGVSSEREGGGGPRGVFLVGLTILGSVLMVGNGEGTTGVGSERTAGSAEAARFGVDMAGVTGLGVRLGVLDDASSESSPFDTEAVGRGFTGAGRDGPEIESRAERGVAERGVAGVVVERGVVVGRGVVVVVGTSTGVRIGVFEE